MSIQTCVWKQIHILHILRGVICMCSAFMEDRLQEIADQGLFGMPQGKEVGIYSEYT